MVLHRDNFKFDQIKDFLRNLIDEGIIIVPTTSKTEKEIEEFLIELGKELPFISENGSSIHRLNLINNNFSLKGSVVRQNIAYTVYGIKKFKQDRFF